MTVSAASLGQLIDARETGRVSLYHKAMASYGEGFLAQAIRHLRDALAGPNAPASRGEELELKAAYGRFLFLAGKTSQGFSFLSEALKLSIEDNEPEAMSRILVELGEVYETWGNPMLALEYLSQAHWILRTSDEFERLLRCLFGLARVHFFMAYHDECASYLDMAREEAERLKEPMLQRLVRLKEVEFSLRLGRTDQVHVLSEEPAPKGSKALARESRILILKCLGMKELFAGRPGSAATYLREMLRVVRRLKHRHTVAEGLLLLSRASLDLGDAAKSEWFLSEGVKLAKRIENRRFQCEGLLMVLWGKADERAATLLRKGLEQARHLHDSELIMRYNYQLALTQASLGHHDKVMDYCIDCRKEYKRLADLSARMNGRVEERRDIKKILLEISRLSDGALN